MKKITNIGRKKTRVNTEVVDSNWKCWHEYMTFTMHMKRLKIKYDINSCLLRRAEAVTHLLPKAMNRPGAQILVSKYLLHGKEAGLHRKIADYKARARNDSRNDRLTLKIFLCKKVMKDAKTNAICQNYSEATLKAFLPAKSKVI